MAEPETTQVAPVSWSRTVAVTAAVFGLVTRIVPVRRKPVSTAAPRVAMTLYGIVAVPCGAVDDGRAGGLVDAPGVRAGEGAGGALLDHEVTARDEADRDGLDDVGAAHQVGEVLVAAVVGLGQDPLGQGGLHGDRVGVGAGVGQHDLGRAVAAQRHVGLGAAVGEGAGAGGDAQVRGGVRAALTTSVRGVPAQVAPSRP